MIQYEVYFYQDVQHCMAIKQRGSVDIVIMTQIFGFTLLMSSIHGI